jgi:hypothetical protein
MPEAYVVLQVIHTPLKHCLYKLLNLICDEKLLIQAIMPNSCIVILYSLRPIKSAIPIFLRQISGGVKRL